MRRYVYCILVLLNFPLQAAVIDSIKSLHQALGNQQITCEKYIQARIERIKRYDLDTSRGAPLNAIIAINPQALQYARKLDDYQKRHGTLTKPLHCVPIVIKDNINMFDIPVTSGSLSMLGSQPVKDAYVVQKLREAGAVILASGAMDEFAAGLIGKSSRSARIGNAFDPTKNPGGSSGGSAVAVASDYALVAIGSDNSGSIRVPAGFNGLFGLRPGSGRIKAEGIFPRGNLDGVIGPITKNPDDMRRILSVLTGQSFHYADKKTYKIGLVTSVAKNNIDFVPYQSFFNHLKTINIELVPIDITDFDNDRSLNTSGEVEDINQYLSDFPSTRRNFKDICTSKRTLTFGTEDECLKYNKENPKHASKAYRKVKAMLAKNRQVLEKQMDKYHLDALFMPISAQGIPSYRIREIYTWVYPLASNSGLPSLAIPCTYSKRGLPVSIELIGRINEENTLLNIAERWYNNYQPLHFPDYQNSNLDLSELSEAQFNNLKTLLGYHLFTHYLKKHADIRITPKQINQAIASLRENLS